MTNCTYTVYVENKTKLMRPIESSPIYDESQIGQRRDQSHRFSLDQNQNSIVETYLTMCGL